MVMHDLDEGNEEYFQFKLGGHTYQMRYPTTEEVFAAKDIKDPTEEDEWLYSFISPTSEGAPPIEEALKKLSVKLSHKFTAMIQAEFSQEN